MRKLSLLILALCFAPAAHALEPATDPSQAAVRIKSHGASGTVIATTEGKSWILSCAHMIADERGNPSAALRQKRLVLDGPPQPSASGGVAQARLVSWDYDADLSLIEIDNGPFQFIPVAPAGTQPTASLCSIGYDNLAWPVTNQRATVLFSQGLTTFTREKPWHGRSGGGLIDFERRLLFGVVQGYEVYPTQRGLYVSHEAILRFLERSKGLSPAAPSLPVGRPRVPPQTIPFSSPCPNGQCPLNTCPNGQCPLR